MRFRTNRKRDHKIFTRTARRTHPRNIPGKIVQRGGTRL